MSDFPDTRDSLLVRIQSLEDQDAWETFVTMYRPLIIRMARNRGLQESDANDLAQRVLLSVALSISRWHKRGPNDRFRHWLRKITRNATLNELTRKPIDLAEGGSAALQFLNEECTDQAAVTEFETEYRRERLGRVLRTIRSDFEPATWRIFEITVLEGRSITEASRELSKSVGSIYAARNRITQRIKEAIREQEEHNE